MGEKRKNHAGKITIPVEVEVKFKTVKPESEDEFCKHDGLRDAG